MLQSPCRMGKTQRAIDLLSDEQFVKLDVNLRYFRERYDTILGSHERMARYARERSRQPYRRVKRLFYE